MHLYSEYVVLVLTAFYVLYCDDANAVVDAVDAADADGDDDDVVIHPSAYHLMGCLCVLLFALVSSMLTIWPLLG